MGEEKTWASELITTNDVLTTEKLTAYLDVIKLFTSFTDPKIQRQVAKSPQKQEALGQKMTKIGMRLALLGSDSVVKGYVKFREMAQMEGKAEDIVRGFGEIMLKMRDDLQGVVTSPVEVSTIDDMLGSFVVGKITVD